MNLPIDFKHLSQLYKGQRSLLVATTYLIIWSKFGYCISLKSTYTMNLGLQNYNATKAKMLTRQQSNSSWYRSNKDLSFTSGAAA